MSGEDPNPNPNPKPKPKPKPNPNPDRDPHLITSARGQRVLLAGVVGAGRLAFHAKLQDRRYLHQAVGQESRQAQDRVDDCVEDRVLLTLAQDLEGVGVRG